MKSIVLEKKLELPSFIGSQKETVLKSMNWVRGNIEKRKWTNKQLEEKFGRRTVAEILKDRHTCYMNPCADYTFLLVEILKKNGFDVTLVIEELKQPYKKYSEVHFAVELFIDYKLHFAEYVVLNKTKFKEGKFVDRFNDRYKLYETRIDAYQLDPFEYPLKSLGVVSPEGLSKVFKYYSFEPHLEQLKKDNTPETYRRFLMKENLN
ncbi:MAG: hypothetical protein ABIH79_02620 [archaeon]